MILLSDELRGWGHIVTAHYSQPPRTAVTQTSLCGRMDFTEIDPVNRIVRAICFFTDFVAGGVPSDLLVTPFRGASQFHAKDVTEFRAQLFADNCGARAVICQFGTGDGGHAFSNASVEHVISFRNPDNGTIIFKHIAKVYGEGRPITEAEAVDKARTNAARLGIDLDKVEMVIATDTKSHAFAQRFDLRSGLAVSTDI
jgi:hypothetical protein